MSDQAELPGAAGRESPVAKTPAAEPFQVPAPPSVVAGLLDEFGRWLERWAVYARAHAALLAGETEEPVRATSELAPAGSAIPGQGPPAHWQAVVTQGPPAHWLALFDKQPAETLQQPAEQPDASPGSLTQAPAGLTDEFIHQFQAELADFLSPRPPQPAASESPTAPPPKAGSDAPTISTGKPAAIAAPPAAQAPAPVEQAPSPPASEPTPVRVTRVRMRLPTPPPPSTDLPSPASPSESLASLPLESRLTTPPPSQAAPARLADVEPLAAQPRVTRLRLNSSQPASPVVPRQLTSPTGSPPPESPQPEPPTSPAPDIELVKDHPLPAPEAEAAPAPLVPRQEAPVPQDTPPPPSWTAPPPPAEALPILWPRATNQAHWPALPDPLPPYIPAPSPFQSPARRSRLDREQGGRTWNG
jgi:hypothetical protein